MRAKKYLLTCTAVAVLTTAALTGCGNKKTNTVNSSDNANVSTSATNDAATGAFKDGTYTEVAAEADNGYTYQVTMTVEGGKITSVDWDALDADGNSKKQASIDGTYVMTEDGPTWAEQSDALAQYVIDNQSLDGLTTDENGKTDVVAGVSVGISSFLELLQACMTSAAN